MNRFKNIYIIFFLLLFDGSFATSKSILSFDKLFFKAQDFLENANYYYFDSINAISGFDKCNNLGFLLLESYKEFSEVYLSQSSESFNNYYKNSKKRIEILESISTVESNYILAEICFHYALLKLYQGDKIDAVSKILKSYKIVENIEITNPEFIYHKKLLGIYHIALSYLPSYMLKIIKIIGLKGDLTKGLKAIEICNNEKYYFYNEIKILKISLDIFSKSTTKNLSQIIIPILPNKMWYNFVNVLIYKKVNKNEIALDFFLKESKFNTKVPIFAYQKACLLLQKLQSKEAELLFDFFIKNTKGENYVKDAFYKLYICKKINNNKVSFQITKMLIKQEGCDVSETDKKALKFANLEVEPNINLLKSMLLMDGGYFIQAEEILKSIKFNSLNNLRNKTEYYYRYARVFESINNLDKSVEYYLKTIELQGAESYYFAPNSCLQLGYLYKKSNKNLALFYFNKVSTYKKHEYKNSLDIKAKIAIKQIDVQ